MNAHKGRHAYQSVRLMVVTLLAVMVLLWHHAAFAGTDPDVTGDGRVNTLDISTVASCMGRDPAVVTRCQCADTNGDAVVDRVDYGFVVANVGRSGYPLEPNACQAKLNTPPTANAGPDQTVTVGRTVALSASGSSDAEGDPLTFIWAFTSRPIGSTATLSNPNTVTPGFVVDRPGNYIVQVSVSDGKASSLDTVSISTTNSPPVAHAGSHQGIFIGSTVILDGSASSDVDGDALSFRWLFARVPPGSIATLSGATTVNPTFVADAAGSYDVQLIVNDGIADSAPGTVTISTRNTPPVANAGADQSVSPGSIVQINGVASSDADGNLLTFAWSLITRPTGSAATLSSVTAVNPTFTADITGTYVAQLIVNDGFVNSPADTVMITVTPVNVAPTARAGADQSAALGGSVQLNGAASSDPEGAPLNYHWSLTSRPTGSTAILSAINIVNPLFIVDRVGTYIAQLIVNDGVLNSLPDTLIVTTFNPTPVANAGPDQTVALGTPAATVTLDGRASSDANGDSLVYSWSFTSVPPGNTAILSNSGTPRPTFTATHAGTYVVQLIVSDGNANSSPDTVMITVTPPLNRAPTAHAGADRTGNVGTATTLNGASSSDPDSDPLTYQWSFTSRPAGSTTVVLLNPTAVNPVFTPDVVGTYTVQLMVNDGTVNSVPDTVVITVVAALLPVMSVTASDAAASEVGLDPGTFTITRNGGATNLPLTVIYTLGGTATNGLDYTSLTGNQTSSGSVIIPANETRIIITITPLSDNAVEGNETVILTLATQPGYTLGTSTSATITIADNAPPSLAPVADRTVRVGATLALALVATDPDGDALSYAVTPLPANASLNTATGMFSFTPVAAQAGVLTLNFSVSDGFSTRTQSTTITVKTDTAPVLAPIPDMTVRTGATLSFNLSAIDRDGDPVIYSATSLPDNASLDATTGAFTFSPNPAQAGRIPVTFTASDGRWSDSQAVNITVEAPSTVSLDILSPTEGATINGDTVQVSGIVYGSPNSGVTVNGIAAAVDGSNHFHATVPLQPGANTLVVTAATSGGQTSTKTLNITRFGQSQFQISASPSQGTAPLTVAISANSRTGYAITQHQYTLDGGTVDAANTDPDVLFKINYTLPGTYRPTVTVTDSVGNTTTQTLVIVMQDPVLMDQMLKSIWDGMNNALVAGDKTSALQHMNASAKTKYDPVFTALLPAMPQIVGSYSPLQRVSISGGIAEYAVNRTIDGVNRIFFIYFIQDADGVWRIDEM